MSLAELGLIGNCQLSALVRRDGAMVWSCMPRFDSAPVFAKLLDERDGGAFTIGAADGRNGVQRYLPNTNVLETTFECPDGSFRVLDFAPRFIQYERSFRPTKLLRVVEPLTGTPRIRVRCDPVLGWSREKPRQELGSHHIAFHGYDALLRLTTDAPLSYLDGEPFALSSRKHFVLAWGAPVEEPLEPLCERFLRETVKYWRQWVKSCDIPPIFQAEVIRSALTLKLHCFEDTGAIVAALTTSIPEAPSSGRTWDYRYCWLRDAYYALGAFRLLGQFEEREQFLQYLLNIATSAPDLDLAPLYRIDGKTNLDEHILEDWPGYCGEKPVRIGNGAAVHKQHDVFGEMVLALAPLFLDARFREQVTPPVLDLVTRLARKAVSVAGQPDAGIWEYRSEWRPQTFSSLMCWAAADRMARIAKLHRPGDAEEFSTAARKIREELLNRAVHTTRGCFVADYGGSEVDAALLQAVTLQLLPPDDPRLHATVDAVQQDLAQDGWLKRYRTNDGFGVPAVAFMLCTFWQVEALARLGRTHEASELMERVRAVKSPLGLYAEDLEPKSQVMWGIFPKPIRTSDSFTLRSPPPALAGVRLMSAQSHPSLPPTPPEAWEPLLRLVRHATRPLERFLRIEAASGIVLLVTAAAALAWANSSWAESYAQVWHMPLGIRIGGFAFERSLEWVVNDGLMVIFFFVVGMEIRREIHHGELSEWRRAALPAIAALGGMLVPAALYVLFAGSPETRSGWGVPMATDIAFAVGILTLLGKRVPAALRVLLLALAVIDDLGAIIVIAVFYSSDFSFAGLFVALIGFLGIFAMQRLGVRSKFAYVAPAFVAWAGVYATGIHPTIAGVIVGLMTPVRAWLGPEGFTTHVRRELDELASPGSLSSHDLTHTLRRVDLARHEAMSPAEALIATLHPWVAFGIMPIFALANAGVTISAGAFDAASMHVATAVFVGLVIGKPVGVLAASVLTLRLGIGKLPIGMTLRHLVVLGVVAGVGFTMALFIAQLAFTEPKLLAAAKLGVLAASGAAAVLGLVLGGYS